ncbi:MAG: L-seryl-tRNA(Sec) selenium transferase, partial [Kiritimatiellae bacterium]|nr:L-seryl-tRNA(Sec) selenium transferase [Kiritimatiellia bacterium]
MNKKSALRTIPSVDKLLIHPDIAMLTEQYGIQIVTQMIRVAIEQLRTNILNNKAANSTEELITIITNMVQHAESPSLHPVINATGIVLHTNLGRAPLGAESINELVTSCKSYSNLEFNTDTQKRGERNVHVEELLKILTNTEAAMVVNNNASSLILTLNALANKKEVIVSRGELIEIGGSFRLPAIMEASGAIMVEVGTTNRTRASDYADAITENTALILKVHKSNFFTEGFTEEA